MNKKLLLAAVLLVVVLMGVYFSQRQKEDMTTPVLPPPPPAPAPVVFEAPPKKPAPVAAAPATPAMAPPPPVKLHPELIPKDIEIVRVYYANQISGPGSEIEFDINGSGFTAEFEKMITVESGNAEVQIKNLRLVTLNQIHGTLLVGPKTATSVSYPQILIQNKVVFRASEPFAVIRPGEVLNVILTEMGDNGQTGRIRVFTNLTPDSFSLFKIEVSTPIIQIVEVTPHLPFIVDATIDTGFRPGSGSYDLFVKLGALIIFEKKGFVRVVRPNVGQTGLAQQVRALDGFHRPGDSARFVVMGSGFLPADVAEISVRVPGFSNMASSLTYVSAGKMELVLNLPKTAEKGAYSLELMHGTTQLLNVPNGFHVVDKNWVRALEVKPALPSGGKGILALIGRDFEKDFVEQIQTEVDERGLIVGAFRFVSAERAEAEVAAAANVAPGDYLLKLTRNGQPVSPAMGSIVRVTEKQP